MRLHPIPTGHLQYVEAGQFIVRLLKDIKDLKLDIQKDNNLNVYINDLGKQSEEFNLALQQFAGQIETAELIALDLLRDRSIITLRRQIEVYEYNQNPEIKQAYAKAHKIMRDYRNLERGNYEVENMGIQNLLATWAGPENKKITEVLNLSLLLQDLNKTAAAFEEKFASRSHETVVKVTYDTRAIKDQILTMYKELANYILAMAKPKDTPAMYLSLLDAVNNGRRYFSDIIARREGKPSDGNDNNQQQEHGVS